jgi:hypothetical protein
MHHHPSKHILLLLLLLRRLLRLRAVVDPAQQQQPRIEVLWHPQHPMHLTRAAYIQVVSEPLQVHQ